MTPHAMNTAPMAIGQDERPIHLLLYCPEQGGWCQGMWLRAGDQNGVVSRTRLALSGRPTCWLPCLSSAFMEVGGLPDC